MDWQALSDLAGTTSFIVWLFAQSPQIYENYIRSSVDGLSLVFVAQWCAGDLTNLLGCLLTQQLPFQIAVASYFCFIDIVILLQYYCELPKPDQSALSENCEEAHVDDNLDYWQKNRARPTEAVVAPVIEYGTFGTSRRYGSTSRPRYGSKASYSSTLPRMRSTTASRTTSPAYTRRPPSTQGRASKRQQYDAPTNYEELSKAAWSVASLAKRMAQRSLSASPSARHHSRRASSPKQGQSGVGAGGMAEDGKRVRTRRGNRDEPSSSSSLSQSEVEEEEEEEEERQQQPKKQRKGEALGKKREDGKAAAFQSSAPSASRKMSDSIVSTGSADEEYGYGFGSASTHDLASAAAASGKTGGGSSPIPEDDSSSGSPGRGRDMTRTAGRILAASTSKTPPSQTDAESSAITITGSGAAPPPTASASTAAEHLDRDQKQQKQQQKPGLFGRFLKRKDSRTSTSPTTRKRTGIVFLGIWGLFVFHGPIRQPGHGDMLAPSFPPQPSGRVLGEAGQDSFDRIIESNSPGQATLQHPVALFYHQLSNAAGRTQSEFENIGHASPSANLKRPTPPSWERLVGRVFAWICTVLYMTSRLPQIWENHVRKSVQGLSILLFIAAALGNFFYTVSVLINPMALEGSPAARHEYLRESLPFLLGSGGTLVFDAVIVGQWIAWRGLQPLGEEILVVGEAEALIAGEGTRQQLESDQEQMQEEGSRPPLGRDSNSMERQPLLPS